ncbi:MAG: GAF domain-containing protein [Deltaproteobacteria bacterium]|nr:GAF domain-containing protein [Deltaproteobacteria bacterium]MBW1794011.1 GAF domain-containing protein [Deltaproteobacteria bacterium]MBW2331055.1 GAF domain-containing protein [Deltaproteobacteria bacterium]
MQRLHKAITEIDVLCPPKIYIGKILKAICHNLGYRFATVIQVDNQGKGWMFASYNLPQDYPEKVNQTEAPVLSSPSGEAIQTGRVIVLHDALSDPRLAPWRELLRPYNVKTIVWVPLLSKGHPFGTYVLYDTHIRDISEQEKNYHESTKD